VTDVGVCQRRQDLRLALESCEPIGVRGEEVGQDLQRDVTLQARVPGAIDLTL
jgi:hypothetical protein